MTTANKLINRVSSSKIKLIENNFDTKGINTPKNFLDDDLTPLRKEKEDDDATEMMFDLLVIDRERGE